MNEQERLITKQEEFLDRQQEKPSDKQREGGGMDYKMMLMMLIMMGGCLAASFLPWFIPSGWLTAGIGSFSFIGIALAVALLFACCIPMMKMMVGGGKQNDDIA